MFSKLFGGCRDESPVSSSQQLKQVILFFRRFIVCFLDCFFKLLFSSNQVVGSVVNVGEILNFFFPVIFVNVRLGIEDVGVC